jgi:hypothetical protein
LAAIYSRSAPRLASSIVARLRRRDRVHLFIALGARRSGKTLLVGTAVWRRFAFLGRAQLHFGAALLALVGAADSIWSAARGTRFTHHAGKIARPLWASFN